jgi:hypothetical protein
MYIRVASEVWFNVIAREYQYEIIMQWDPII